MKTLTELHRRLVERQPLSGPEKLLFFLLLPLSVGYGLIGQLRNIFYDCGIAKCEAGVLPVVSVGNLAVGGTGKTPVVDWLVKEFLRYGKQPAIVSRGYSGHFRGRVGQVSDGSALLMATRECGDEPYLLAKRNPGVQVVIARKRIDGIRFVEKDSAVDVIILDDAFQHRAVRRDIDLVLLDGRRPLGNGWPLPAGNLREFPEGLARADFLLLTRSQNYDLPRLLGRPLYCSDHCLADVAVDLNGTSLPVKELRGMRVLAFAGIGKPDHFFQSLKNLGLNVVKSLSFDDHTAYTGEILAQLHKNAVDVDVLVTTEKDGVKLSADMFELPCYQVAVDIRINRSAELFEKLVQRLWSDDMSICSELLEILACPKCKGKVVPVDDNAALLCESCWLRYPVRDGIPVMLIDEADVVESSAE